MVIYVTRVKHFTLYYYYSYTHSLNGGHISSRGGLAKSFNALTHISRIVYQIEITHTHTRAHVHTSSTVNKKVTIYYNVLLSCISIIIPHRYFYSTILYFRAQARGVQQTKTHCVIFVLINNTVISRSSVFFHTCEKHDKHDDDEPL